MKPASKTHSTTDTIELTKSIVGKWKPAPFQREVKTNEKVRTLAASLRADSGVVPGILTLGVVDGKTYLIDGQHRVHAFLLSELPVGYADIRTVWFETMGAMGREFVDLNSRLVSFKPDDVLRGLEESCPPLGAIRKKCPFVGYGNIRRNDKSPIISMAATLRCWSASAAEAPTGSPGPALFLAETLTDADASALVAFLSIVFQAWGRDVSSARLWTALNMTMCAWLYRRVVLSCYSKKTTPVSKELFTKCMMSVAADDLYVDWLLGRKLGDRDRSPAYARLKSIVSRRILSETGAKSMLPHPAWSVS